MGSSDVATLARVWADAIPLAQYISDKTQPRTDQAKSARKGPHSRPLSTAEQLASAMLIMEFHTNLRTARDKVRSDTINDLIAGRVVAVGRPSDSYNFERIPPSLWVGAALDWDRDCVSRDGRKLLEVRIVKPDDIPLVQPKLYEVRGRPSKGEVISAAIEEYAKKDPTLGRPPMERLRAYYNYISARGYKPRTEKGFGPKTIQKFERIFRNKNK